MALPPSLRSDLIGADRYGSVLVPVPTGIDGHPVGDPMVYYLGQFLQAIGNARTGDAWRSVAPTDEGVPIRSVVYLNPGRTQGLALDENRFPTLCVYRERVLSWKQVASSIRVATWRLMAVWLPHADQAEAETDQGPFWSALFSAFDIAINLGRDPAWIVPGDNYYRAQKYGSLLAHFSKHRRLWPLEGAGPMEIEQKPLGDQEKLPPLAAYGFPMKLEEQLYRDVLLRWSPVKGLRGSVVTTGPDPNDPNGPTTTVAYSFPAPT